MKNKQKVIEFLTDWTIMEILGSILIVPIIVYMLFFGQNIAVNGQSMSPTFDDSDRLVASRSIEKLDHGDIVIIKSSVLDERIIKRVIGLPGDTIEIKDNALFLNGSKLNEPYLDEEMRGNNDCLITLSKESIWVMGDNRNHSGDSRMIGEIPLNEVTGEVFVRYFSRETIQTYIGLIKQKLLTIVKI